MAPRSASIAMQLVEACSHLARLFSTGQVAILDAVKIGEYLIGAISSVTSEF